MKERVRRTWEAVRRDAPGERFQNLYRRRQEPRRGRVKLLLVAGALLLVGVVFVFTPGPAFVFLGLGGALLAEESLVMARLLDWIELRARRATKRIQRVWATWTGGGS